MWWPFKSWSLLWIKLINYHKINLFNPEIYEYINQTMILCFFSSFAIFSIFGAAILNFSKILLKKQLNYPCFLFLVSLYHNLFIKMYHITQFNISRKSFGRPFGFFFTKRGNRNISDQILVKNMEMIEILHFPTSW